MKQSRLSVMISIVLALLGFLVTAYLSMQSLSAEAAVAGCGGNSGCEAVLSSRWAKLGPVPVSVLGALTYLVVLLGLGARMGSKGYSPMGDRMLWVTPPLLIVAAIWFTGVQLLHVRAVCPFCMTSHAIGLTLALVLVFGVMRTTIARPKPPLMIGFLAGGALIIGQLAIPPGEQAVATAANPFVDQDGDAVINGQRHISLFGGALQFTLDEVPYLGESDARQVVAVVFDYACPHCKALHKMLDEAIAQDPSRFVMVPVPLSIHEDYNPYIASDDARFVDSETLARISLSVAAIDREKWVAFDRWLFDGQGDAFPRSTHDATMKAIELIGDIDYKEQMNNGGHDEAVKRNIELLSLLPEDKRFIPITTTPGAPSHLTERFEDIKVLQQMLDAAATTLSVDP